TRAAEVLSEGLVQMRGATAPRLLLELMCAQMLLPGASQDHTALLARLERLERGAAPSGRPVTPAASAVPSPAPAVQETAPRHVPEPASAPPRQAGPPSPKPQPQARP